MPVAHRPLQAAQSITVSWKPCPRTITARFSRPNCATLIADMWRARHEPQRARRRMRRREKGRAPRPLSRHAHARSAGRCPSSATDRSALSAVRMSICNAGSPAATLFPSWKRIDRPGMTRSAERPPGCNLLGSGAGTFPAFRDEALEIVERGEVVIPIRGMGVDGAVGIHRVGVAARFIGADDVRWGNREVVGRSTTGFLGFPPPVRALFRAQRCPPPARPIRPCPGFARGGAGPASFGTMSDAAAGCDGSVQLSRAVYPRRGGGYTVVHIHGPENSVSWYTPLA